jgi:hypothetical protein
METREPCRCAGCLLSIPPAVGATQAKYEAHAGYLRKLAAIGALPDLAFQPYPQPAVEHGATTTLQW